MPKLDKYYIRANHIGSNKKVLQLLKKTDGTVNLSENLTAYFLYLCIETDLDKEQLAAAFLVENTEQILSEEEFKLVGRSSAQRTRVITYQNHHGDLEEKNTPSDRSNIIPEKADKVIPKLPPKANKTVPKNESDDSQDYFNCFYAAIHGSLQLQLYITLFVIYAYIL